MLALLFGVLSGPVQRAMLAFSFNAVSGAQIQIGGMSKHGGTTDLSDVTITGPAGSGTFTVKQLTVTKNAAGPHVLAVQPSGSLVFGHETLRKLRRLAAGLGLLAGASPASVTLEIRDGSMQIAREGSAAPPFTISSFNGTLQNAPSLDIEGSATAGPADNLQPVTFAGGHARAAQLALAPLAALLPPSAVSVESGIAHDLDISWANGPSGTIGISGLNGSYGAHVLHALHGTILFSPNGMASHQLSGFIDNVPLQIAGEVHDVRNWNDALRNGTRGLRGLARSYDLIAPTDRLRSIKLEATAPGITYAQYEMLLDDLPRAVQFLTIDPHEKTLHFNTALSGNHLISKGERTSDMGIRTHAVAGLNGDYFDIAATYQPQGMFMMNGRLVRGPVDRQALILDRDNNVYFSEFHLDGSLQVGARTLKVTQYNDWPLGYVTIVTPDFGQSLPPAPGVRFLSLQYLRGDRYRVTAIKSDAPPEPLTFGVAIGPDVKGLKTPEIGSVVHLHYAIDPPVKHAVAGIGGGPLLLRNGQWYEDPHAPAPDERDVRWPVDALGVLADRSLIMVAVDGRHPERSVGMTRPEFGKLLQQLGVTDAMALDSGGSVTMVARSPGDSDVSLHNVPSDDSEERYISNALFVYSSAPVGTLLQNRVTASASLRN